MCFASNGEFVTLPSLVFLFFCSTVMVIPVDSVDDHYNIVTSAIHVFEDLDYGFTQYLGT